MVRGEVKFDESTGVYVVKIGSESFNIEKRYLEEDKLYEILKRIAYFCLKLRRRSFEVDFNELDEIIDVNWFPKVSAKAYFYAMEHLGYVKIVEEKRVNVKMEAEINMYILEGLEEYLNEEIEKIRRHLDEIEANVKNAEKDINELLTNLDKEIKNLAKENKKLMTKFEKSKDPKERERLSDMIREYDSMIRTYEELIKNIEEGGFIEIIKFIKDRYRTSIRLMEMFLYSIKRLKPMSKSLVSLEKSYGKISSIEELRNSLNELIRKCLMGIIGAIEIKGKALTNEELEEIKERSERYYYEEVEKPVESIEESIEELKIDKGERR